MIGVRKITMFSCIVIAVISPAVTHPADSKDGNEKPTAGNLMYTFGSRDEIPAAFFEGPQRSANDTRRSSGTSVPPQPEIRVYPACKDGSGGMCVGAGQCPANLRPETSEPGACEDGRECCFGAPENDKSCSSRGGECRPAKECGGAPTFLEAEDCDKKNGQICCILV